MNWRNLCFAMVAGLIGSLMGGAAQKAWSLNDTVQCRTLEIVDERGRAWVELTADEDGGAIHVRSVGGDKALSIFPNAVVGMQVND